MTYSVSGLPAGLTWTAPPASGGEIVISGTYTGAERSGVSSPLTVVAIDSLGLSTTSTVDLYVEQYGASPQRGQIIITEVLYQETGAGSDFDEFAEIQNVSAVPIPVSGFQLAEFNVKTQSGEGPVGQPYTVPDTNPATSEPYLLLPGQRLVLWVNTVAMPAPPPGDPVTDPLVPFYLSANGNPNPSDILDNVGDELWMLDADERVIAYVAWGTNEPGSQVGAAPPVPLEIWDASGTGDGQLLGAAPGVSISLASPKGSGNTDPNCWEFTGTATATCAQADPAGTLDSDPTSRVASPGQPNTP